MPIPNDFEYIKPQNLSEAVNLMNNTGIKKSILAGGTDLCNMLKMGFRVPDLMIDIKGLDELHKIELSDHALKIGALVTFSEIIESDLIKEKMFILWEAAHLVASVGIRNRATMIGNICSAVACMDSAAPLLVHEAKVHTISADGMREINIQNWFVDNKKTDIKENEIVTGISIPISDKKYAGSYNKLMRYSGEDLSQANVGILLFDDMSVKVAFGAVGPTPKRSLKIESFLNQKQISDSLIEEAKNMIDTVIAPISDVRASKEYRLHMTKVMFERGLKTANERLNQIK